MFNSYTPPRNPLLTRPSRITGTMEEWTKWVNGLTRRERDKLYPGMHISLIPAYEKIVGMDQGDYPKYTGQTHSGKQSPTQFTETSGYQTNTQAPTSEASAAHTLTSAYTSPNFADPFKPPTPWSPDPTAPRFRDSNLNNSPTQNSDTSGLPLTTFEASSARVPYSSPFSMQSLFGPPMLGGNNTVGGLNPGRTGAAPPLPGGPGFGSALQPPSSPGPILPIQPTAPGPVTAVSSAFIPVGREQTGNKPTGLLDLDYASPLTGQKPPSGAWALLGNISQGMKNAIVQAKSPQVSSFGDLLSVIADANVVPGVDGAAYYAGVGDQETRGEGEGQETNETTESASLPDITHNPGSRTYTYNDPENGPRDVVPFADKIPGFDWHRDRNMFNIIPGIKPHRVYKEVWHGNAKVREFSHYEDHLGNEWTADFLVFTGPYHGNRNYSFRGTGQYTGCQAVYTPNGKVITSGPQRSTFDYGRPGTGAHGDVDIDPHKADSGYRDPDLSTVF